MMNKNKIIHYEINTLSLKTGINSAIRPLRFFQLIIIFYFNNY
jgi:hypothetical protein